MKRWYVVQTKPARESDVSLLFRQGGFEALLPKIQETCYRASRPYFKTAPLFPGYLFLNTDFDESSNFHKIKYTRGVNKILCAENRPIPMPQVVIDTICERINAEGFVEKPMTLKAGDEIRIRKGMLKDLVGIMEKPTSADGRVVVLLNLVNYSMKATVHWTEVERLQVA